jgi:ribosomal RNA-processing protein 9
VNGLEFFKAADGEMYVIAAIGQEHRMGRWYKIKNARNSVQVLKLGKVAVADE